MKKRKYYDKTAYVLAFLISIFLLLTGIYLTILVSQAEISRIEDSQSKLSYGLFEQKILTSFFSEDLCDGNSLDTINNYRSTQVGIMDSLEKKYGVDNKKVIERKKFYTLIQVAHLEFLENKIKNCNESRDILIFFYSNSNDDLDESSRVGRMLTIFGVERKDIEIYSFDFNLESDLIDALKYKYNVTQHPSIVNLNGNSIFSPKHIEEIRSLLD